MNTSFSEIYDLFVRTINDYKVNEHFRIGADSLETYLEPFLRFAVFQIDKTCETDLSDSLDLSLREFKKELNEKEKVLIATLMAEHWFKPVLNDLLDIQMGLSSTDFKRTAEGQHLKEVESKYQQMREESSQLLVDYQMRYVIDWKQWQNGNFYDV